VPQGIANTFTKRQEPVGPVFGKFKGIWKNHFAGDNLIHAARRKNIRTGD
jgi:hypothetical protein